MRIVLKATNFGNLMGSSPVIPSQYDRPVGDHGDSICNCHNKSAYEGGGADQSSARRLGYERPSHCQSPAPISQSPEKPVLVRHRLRFLNNQGFPAGIHRPWPRKLSLYPSTRRGLDPTPSDNLRSIRGTLEHVRWSLGMSSTCAAPHVLRNKRPSMLPAIVDSLVALAIKRDAATALA